MRKLVYQTVQTLFVGASQTVTLRTPWFLQPLQGYAGALRGNAYNAQKVIDPAVSFYAEDSAGIANLALYQAQVETTYEGVLGDTSFYVSTADISAQFLLQGGNFVPEISGHALARAGLILTNRSTGGRTLMVRTEVFGQMWWDSPLTSGVEAMP